MNECSECSDQGLLIIVVYDDAKSRGRRLFEENQARESMSVAHCNFYLLNIF